MEKPISSFLRSTFLVHMIIGGLLGIFLLLIPGRTLTFLGWVPETFTVPNTDITAPGTVFVDAVISRLLGAAVLAFAISSFLGWRAKTWGQVTLIVQAEMVYSPLSALAFLSRLILYSYLPAIGYVLIFILMAFFAAWVWAYRQGTRT